jgi:DNA-directed RNA polymerase specialized sigma24 family protein
VRTSSFHLVGSQGQEDAASRLAESNMTPDDFEELLLWLDPDPDGTGVPDRERGAEKYEKICQRLIKIYRNRGSRRAEDIADETADRVGRQAKRLRLTFEGDPAIYFYAVAKRVYLEFRRDDDFSMPPPLPRDDPEEVERRHARLEDCLGTLKPESRELILRFYEGEKKSKIENRKRLAAGLGITTKALSLRALHIRRKLHECMSAYLKE